MTGDGTDDYLWLSPEGDLNFWENIHKPPLWRPYGVIYKPGALVTDRRNVHLADLTGDRRCDYVIVNPATNEVRMLQNTGNSGSSFTFVDKGKVFNGNACNPPSKSKSMSADCELESALCCFSLLCTCASMPLSSRTNPSCSHSHFRGPER